MKAIIGTLLAGGTLVSADLPNVDFDECAIVTLDIARDEPTFVDPEPNATSMQIIVYCGQRTFTEGGMPINQRELKYIDVDLEQAEAIVLAADDMLADDDIYLP